MREDEHQRPFSFWALAAALAAAARVAARKAEVDGSIRIVSLL